MAQACAALESPCLRACVIDASSGWCRGCWRSLDEISFWVRYTGEEQRQLMQHLEVRRATACAATP